MRNVLKGLRRVLLACGVVVLAAPAVHSQAAGPVAAVVGGLEIGKPAVYGKLAVYPLIAADRTAPELREEIATLDEALERGWLLVQEQEGGSVPEVLVTNRSDMMIYIMGGEILSGCKQDRIVRRDVLIAPRRKRLRLPVYCVEQGRWTATSKSFSSERNLGTYELRNSAQKEGGTSQYEIWDGVAEVNRKLGVESATGAFQDALRDAAVDSRLAETEIAVEKAIRFPEGTTGVAVCIGERIAGVDLFAGAHLFEALWLKILRSAALSAYVSSYLEPEEGRANRDDVEEFLRRIASADPERETAVDLGTGLWMEAEDLQAGGLLFNGRILHLGAFPAEESRRWENRWIGENGPAQRDDALLQASNVRWNEAIQAADPRLE